MLQIRNGMFETNSSSCHVFMFPKDMGIKVPSTIKLSDTYEETLDNMPNLFFNDCNWGKEYTDSLIIFFYKCGVKTIKYSGRHDYVYEAIKNYKDNYDIDTDFRWILHLSEENLKKVCFGTDVHLTVMQDYEVSEEAVASEGDFESYCSYRLS